MQAENEEKNEKQYIFDEEDTMLFSMKNLPLKGRAIQNYILPKLENILLESISEVNNYYGIEVFNENSSTAFTPNFREKRKTDAFVDWQFAQYSLCGERKSIWKGVTEENCKIIPFMPFFLSYYFDVEGLMLNITFDRFNQKNNQYYKYYQFIRDNLGVIIKLCKFAEMDFDIEDNSIDGMFIPYEVMLDDLIETKKYSEYSVVISRIIEPPITDEQIEKLKNSFINIYPIYDSLIKISLGEEPRFDEMIDKIQSILIETYDYILSLPDDTEELSDDEESTDETQAVDFSERIDDLVNTFQPRAGIRWQVFDRDNFRCVACGKSAGDGVLLHVDHIMPRSKGGKDELDNFQTLCHLCNIGKSNKSDRDLRKRE